MAQLQARGSSRVGVGFLQGKAGEGCGELESCRSSEQCWGEGAGRLVPGAGEVTGRWLERQVRGVRWGKGMSVGSWRRRDIGVLQRSQATAGLLRANYTFARPGNGVVPFMGCVRGLVEICCFLFLQVDKHA